MQILRSIYLERKILFLAFLLIFAVKIMPLDPGMPAAGIDPSWRFALNEAISSGMSFGKEVVFTFGPYAYLYTNLYHPDLFHAALLSSAYLTIAFSLLSYCIFHRHSWLIAAFFFFSLVELVGARDPLFFLYPLMVLVFVGFNFEATESKSRKIYLGLVAFIFSPFGLLPLIKGSLIAVCLVVPTLSVCFFFFQKRYLEILICVLSPFFSLILFWLLSGQNIIDIYSYFYSMKPIISGYTDAMSVVGANVFPILFFISSSLIILILIFKIKYNDKIHLFFVVSGIFLLCFVVFKSAFVRNDGHAVNGGQMIILYAAIASTLVRSKDIPLVILIGLVPWVAIDAKYVQSSTRDIIGRGESVISSLESSFSLLFDGQRALNSRYEDAIAKVRETNPLPEVEGTSDIYSYNQSMLIASGARWSPRPVFQSYSAYKPELVELNKAHLENTRAPDNIFFEVQSIDGRYPSLADGASWSTIFSRYDPHELTGSKLWLKKRHEPLELERGPLSSGIYRMGEVVDLPSLQSAAFVKLDIRPTFLGKIANLFYKSSELDIQVELSSGRSRSFRIVPGMAKSGFYLSPLVESTNEFALLAGGSGYLSGQTVKSFYIRPRAHSYFWKSDYMADIQELRVPFRRTSVQKRPVEAEQIKWADGQAECHGTIDNINGILFSSHKAPVQLDRAASIKGWLFKSERGALRTGDVHVFFSRNGKVEAVYKVDRQDRPDVGAYFNREELRSSGFSDLLDLSTLHGKYEMTLAYIDNGELNLCNQISSKVVVK